VSKGHFSDHIDRLRARQSDLPPEDADRYKAALATCNVREVMGKGGMLANRIGDERKQRFVEAFIEGDHLSMYPYEQDQVDENEWPEGGRKKPTIQATLVAEIRRAYQQCGYTKGPDPVAVATDLLASEHGSDLREISTMATAEITPALLLAHLEALGFGLPPRVAASVARRATIILLNRRMFAAPPSQRRARRPPEEKVG